PGRGGDDLVAVERQDAGGPEGAGRPAAVGGTEGLGGVLHHRDPESGGQAEDGVVVGAGAVEVDGDDGGRKRAPLLTVSQFGGQEPRRHLPGDGIGIDETRPGPAVGDGVGGGGERGRRNQDVVPWAHADLQQREVQGGG